MKHKTISKPWFEILEVEPNCSFDQLRRAYRQKAFQYHPDRLPGNADKFLALRRAYEAGLDQINATPEQKQIVKVQKSAETAGRIVFKGLYYSGMFVVELIRSVCSAFQANSSPRYPDYPHDYGVRSFKREEKGYTIVINNLQNNEK